MVVALLWPINAALAKHLNSWRNLTVAQLLDGCADAMAQKFHNSEEVVATGVSHKVVPQ